MCEGVYGEGKTGRARGGDDMDGRKTVRSGGVMGEAVSEGAEIDGGGGK